MHQADDQDNAHPSSRRRWLPIAAIAGLAAVVAGGSGAVGAVLARHSDSSQPAAAGGPSIYVPYAGPQGNAQLGTSTSLGAVGVAPAPGAAAGYAAPSMARDLAYPYPYPYPGNYCTGTQPVQVSAQVLTATGMSRIDTPAGPPTYALNASVTGHNANDNDVSKEIADAQARIGAVADALAKAGIPKGSIHTSFVSVWANSGGKPQPVPLGVPQPGMQQANVNASVTAEFANTDIINSAVSAASNAGADNVNLYTQWPSASPPSSDALSAALSQATGQAKSLADASAKAAGVNLGGIHALSTQPPTLCGYGPGGPQLVVAVTIAYDIK